MKSAEMFLKELYDASVEIKDPTNTFAEIDAYAERVRLKRIDMIRARDREIVEACKDSIGELECLGLSYIEEALDTILRDLEEGK